MNGYVELWGWDATLAAPQWRKALVDAAGRFQVDTVIDNFPADYPLPAAQVASLQSVHLYGYDGAAWQTLLVESDVLKNLRVKLYDGADGIDSQTGTAPFMATERSLHTAARLFAVSGPAYFPIWADQANSDAVWVGAYNLSTVARLYGFNGATFDRLRTYGTGILKVGRAEIDSTTVRLVAAGLVVAGTHNLYWVACSPDAPNAEWELTDAIAALGAVVYDHFDADKHSEHLHFDPPMKFTTGIWVETFANMKSLVFCYI